MSPQGSLKPRPKVAAGGLAGSVTLILVFIVGQFGVDVPPEVASAVTVLIGTGAAYLLPEGSYVKG